MQVGAREAEQRVLLGHCQEASLCQPICGRLLQHQCRASSVRQVQNAAQHLAGTCSVNDHHFSLDVLLQMPPIPTTSDEALSKNHVEKYTLATGQ